MYKYEKLVKFYSCGCFPAILPVLHHDVGINPTTNIEFCAQSHEARLAGLDQIVEYLVGDVLVEGTLIAKRPDIQLEGFQFDAVLVRYVFQEQRGEIRLAGFRAQAAKLRRTNTDGVVPVRMRVGKGLEMLAGLR